LPSDPAPSDNSVLKLHPKSLQSLPTTSLYCLRPPFVITNEVNVEKLIWSVNYLSRQRACMGDQAFKNSVALIWLQI